MPISHSDFLEFLLLQSLLDLLDLVALLVRAGPNKLVHAVANAWCFQEFGNVEFFRFAKVVLFILWCVAYGR